MSRVVWKLLHWIRNMALLKLDVDGHELGVLRGGGSVLRRDRPKIFMEYSLPYLRDVGVAPAELRGLLEPIGYDRITLFDPHGRPLGRAASFEDLERRARAAEQYLDVLLEVAA